MGYFLAKFYIFLRNVIDKENITVYNIFNPDKNDRN